jgi:hypothetical protein
VGRRSKEERNQGASDPRACSGADHAFVLPAIADNQGSALLKQYRGAITSVRIDRCGTRPGLCEGAIILAHHEGAEVTLAIRPRTWIKRGERLVLLEELRVDHDVHMQAIEIAAGIP